MPILVREIVLKYKLRKAKAAEKQSGYLSRITNAKQVVNAVSYMADTGIERFVCLYLNSKSRLLARQTVEEGTVNYSHPIMREVFRYALAVDASSLVFVHNHPSGDPHPSKYDKKFTKMLAAAGNILGIPVMDHIIIARDLEIGDIRYYSFSEKAK
jgi:DNA repair protein RadC